METVLFKLKKENRFDISTDIETNLLLQLYTIFCNDSLESSMFYDYSDAIDDIKADDDIRIASVYILYEEMLKTYTSIEKIDPLTNKYILLFYKTLNTVLYYSSYNEKYDDLLSGADFEECKTIREKNPFIDFEEINSDFIKLVKLLYKAKARKI